MKSILKSIHPKWVVKILNGEKTIEICTTAPNCTLPIDVYIYCTRSSSDKYLTKMEDGNFVISYSSVRREHPFRRNSEWNSKVVAKFTLKEGDTHIVTDKFKANVIAGTADYSDFLNACCLSGKELFDYVKGNKFYALHISDLQIFDKPKELREFKKHNYQSIINDIKENGCGDNAPKYCLGVLADQCNESLCPRLKITRPPQSWQYVEVVHV